jgi:hypothetical protein
MKTQNVPQRSRADGVILSRKKMVEDFPLEHADRLPILARLPGFWQKKHHYGEATATSNQSFREKVTLQ